MINIFYHFTTTALLSGVSLFLIGWILTHSEWFQNALDEAFDWTTAKFIKYGVNLWLLNQLYIVLGCQKCLTFWIVLCFTWNPLIALGCAYAAHLGMMIEKIANKK
jgi:ABC-type Fe3+-siderophore transport system permease subunit